MHYSDIEARASHPFRKRKENNVLCVDVHLLDGLVHELEVIVVEHDASLVLERLIDRDRVIVRFVSA